MSKIPEMVSKLNVLVVGDIMLDEYTYGDVTRISPEAPVPVVRVLERTYCLGGTGNVVRNLCELGVNVTCFSKVGDDKAGLKITEMLEEIGCNSLMVKVPGGTIVKNRIVAGENMFQMLRIDDENYNSLDRKTTLSALDILSNNEFDYMIISDYNKGMINEFLFKKLRNSQMAPMIVDPKPANQELYKNCYILTPNSIEDKLMNPELFKSTVTFKTCGKDGIILRDSTGSTHIPTEPVQVYNVSGAGDTVVAAITACHAIDELDYIDYAKIANACARYVVQQPKTSVVPINEFTKIVEEILKEK